MNRIGSPLHTNCGIVGGGEPPGKRSSPGTRCPGHSGPNIRQRKENVDSKTIYLFKMAVSMS